ncbi:MAG: cohesin domain-containing protein [Euryarchaeota archaeon]|nr:cohesin domain-containing protein [Euryarchaeota archaeon]
MGKIRKDNIGKSVLARCAVICFAVVVISFSLIPGLAAQGVGGSVNVTVNAPEYVEGTFNASIDVDSVTDFNSGEFDLSFNSSVVNVTCVKGGKIDGKAVPLFDWDFIDADTVKVLVKLPGAEGASGSGNLAEIEFQVNGKSCDKSKLDISKGLLSDTRGVKEIEADWYDAEVTVGAAELPNMTMTVTPGSIPVSVPALVTINVSDGNTGAPINGAIVKISKLPWWPGESNTTINGECSFTVTSNFPGSIDVDANAPGYKNASTELIVATELPNMTMTVTPGSIPVSVPTLVTINVSDGNTGAPISGAIVKISKLPWWPGESNTTINGECSFTVTSNYPGSIDVDASAPGYNDASAELIVATGPTLAWEIEPPTSVEQGDNVTFDLCFSEPASYVISIKNSSGLVVTSWSGTEKDPKPVIWTMTTSDALGDYTIEITIEDVVVATRTVTVSEPIERVLVTVNAPEHVEKGGTFVATIWVEHVTYFNAAQFDLSFNSSVVNVTDVKDGKINGANVTIFDWRLNPDKDTARVIIMMPIGEGVSGSGYLAEVEFEVTGEAGEKSELKFSNGKLVDSEAKEIAAKWIGDEVTVKE